MREPNDLKLAQDVPDIDLILGGHDHHYEIREVWWRRGLLSYKIIKTDNRWMDKQTDILTLDTEIQTAINWPDQQSIYL